MSAQVLTKSMMQSMKSYIFWTLQYFVGTENLQALLQKIQVISAIDLCSPSL